MSTPFISEIKIFAFGFAPKGWATCSGQTLAIAQNQALFSLLGTTYGGNGQTTFQLPNLQGRGPVHFGFGAGLSAKTLGERSGEEAHTLIISEMPQHVHAVGVVNRPGTQVSPASNHLASHRGGYAASGNAVFSPAANANTGGSQPHNNMPPYLVLNFCIAMQGIFPSQN
ncbi:MAG: phage tail protein [Betaproteobacteria bacterium]|nr:phage tail protein [Betaproteobacteria bacterium]